MEQNIKLNDGELAVVIGEASIIMNVNTAFELAEKAKHFTGSANEEKPKEKPESNDDIITDDIYEINKCKIIEEDDDEANELKIISFKFNRKRAEFYNDLREGVGEACFSFDSIRQAASWYNNISCEDVKAVINTWLPYQYQAGVMKLKYGNVQNARFSSKYKGKKLQWSAEHRLGLNEYEDIIFLRADSIPQFILNKNCDLKRIL